MSMLINITDPKMSCDISIYIYIYIYTYIYVYIYIFFNITSGHTLLTILLRIIVCFIVQLRLYLLEAYRAVISFNNGSDLTFLCICLVHSFIHSTMPLTFWVLL